MAKLMRYLTLPAPKRRRTEKNTRNNKNGEAKGNNRTTSISESYYSDELCSIGDHLLSRKSMRLVLLAENEYRCLFDSDTVRPLSEGVLPGAKKGPDGRYQYLRRSADVVELGQMLFGTTTAAVGGAASVKMHTLGDDKMLVSRVFTMPAGGAKNGSKSNDQSDSVASSLESDYGCPLTVHSLDGLSHNVRKAATSCLPPERFSLSRHHRRSRQSSLQTTSGIVVDDCDSSCLTDWDEMRALSPPHRVFSRTRRDEALQANSLQDDENTLVSLRSRISSLSADTEVKTIGLGVILESNERHFVLQHMPLIEGELRRLQSRVQVAAADHATFIHHVYEAWYSFCSCLCSLHNSARLRDPVWMHLLIQPRDPFTTARFCSLLAETSAICETKHTKFFLSNVITAILMHHMAWIASVATPPVKRAVDERMGEKQESGPPPMATSSLNGVNPHLAQLLEISGCVGGASRSARTVVCGSDGALVSKILHVLSYFIRCTSIGNREDLLTPEEDCTEALHDFPSEESAIHHDHSDYSDSSIGNGSINGDVGHVEVPSTSSSALLSSHEHQWGLGESLLAGPSYSYCPHFVLSGLLHSEKSKYNNCLIKVCDEMSSYADSSLASARLEMCPASPAPDHITIIADCTNWTVKVLTGDVVSELHSPSELIVQMMETFSGLQREGVSPHLLTDIMEDSLSDLLSKSMSLTQVLQLEGAVGPVDRLSSLSSLTAERVTAVVGCDPSDLRLLLNIASVYCPTVLASQHDDSEDDHIDDL